MTPTSLTRALALSIAMAALAGSALATPQTQAPSIATVTATGLQYEGFSFERNVKVADTELVLNGVGRRAPLKFHVYAAALYLPHKLSTGAAILAEPGAKRLQLRMQVSGPSKYFVDAFDGGIRKRVPAEQLVGMTPRVEAFDAQLRAFGDLKENDVINLDFVPAKGTVVSVNGRTQGGAVPGEDLYRAMLSIFVGDRALDKAMREGLLGGTPN